MPNSYIPPRPIIIAPYDFRWPVIYQEEKHNIERVLVNKIITIEHIGSTAVPNLSAKPVIDIMVGIETFEIATKCIELLKTIGYEYISEYEKDIPMRRFLCRRSSLADIGFHLHMVIFNENFWRTHLLFRNYLRSHHEALIEYQNLKQKLAKRYVTDVVSYCDAKAEFINKILDLASQEN